MHIKIQFRNNKVGICRDREAASFRDYECFGNPTVAGPPLALQAQRVRVFLSRRAWSAAGQTVRQATPRKGHGRKCIHGKSRICSWQTGDLVHDQITSRPLVKYREFLRCFTRRARLSRDIGYIVQKINVVCRKLFCTVNGARSRRRNVRLRR